MPEEVIAIYTPQPVVSLFEELCAKYKNLEICESMIDHNMHCVENSFLEIGFALKQIRYWGWYPADKTFLEYCSDRFGLSAASVSNIIGVVRVFYDVGGRVLPEYKDFSYSQLVELLPICDEPWRKEITPAMSVRQIRELKKEHKALAAKEKFQTSENAVVEVADPEPVKGSADDAVITPKNDRQRRILFSNYRAWGVYFVDKLTGFVWRRIELTNGDVVVACTTDDGHTPMFWLKEAKESVCVPSSYVYGGLPTSLIDYLRMTARGAGVLRASLAPEYRDRDILDELLKT